VSISLPCQGWLDRLPDLSEPYRSSPKISHRAWFSPEEYKQLYEATRKRAHEPKQARFKWECEQLHDYVLFMANTGLRPDEASRLEYRDVKIVDDAGSFALANPRNFAISNSGKLLVIDPPAVFEFDQFGNGIRKISLPGMPGNVNSLLKIITFSNKSQVILLNDSDLEMGLLNPMLLSPNQDEEIMDACAMETKLFVLTKERILIYNIIR